MLYEGGNLKVEEYIDANFQSNKDDSKSQFGYMFTLNKAVVTWKSFKQEITVDFIIEIEYMVAVEAVKEALWMKKFIIEIGVVPSFKDSILLYLTLMELLLKKRNQGVINSQSTF